METCDSDSDATVSLFPNGTPGRPSTFAANEEDLLGNISRRRVTGNHTENPGELREDRNSYGQIILPIRFLLSADG